MINENLSNLKMAVAMLKPDPKNARTHSKKNIEAIKASLEQFGQQKPIVALKDGTVIAGNGTLQAAKELGWTELAVVSFKDEKKARAFAIADNRSAELAEWDTEELAEALKDIGTDYEVGFSSKDAADIMDEAEWLKAKGVEEDETPEMATKSRVKRGEVYALGKHRLICGDSTSAEDVRKLMGGRLADMVFTDPPYNVDYGASKKPKHIIRPIENDKLGATAWASFNASIIQNIKDNYSGGDIYVWGASSPEGMRQRLWLSEAGFHWSATIIWNKSSLVLGPANYQRKYEPCFYGWLKKSTFRADRKQTEVWDFDKPSSSKLHPTMKPVELCALAIENSSKAGEAVLDLFGGSGSTLIACEKLGREAYLCELDLLYCEVILQRWELLTGKAAKMVKA